MMELVLRTETIRQKKLKYIEQFTTLPLSKHGMDRLSS